MTKRELVDRLSRDPICIEPQVAATHCWVTLDADRGGDTGVWVALAPVAGTLLVGSYETVFAAIDGERVQLSYRETERIVSRLRRLFASGAMSLPGATLPLNRTDH